MGEEKRIRMRQEIEATRQELDRLTLELVKLIRRREELALRIGKLKAELGLGLKDEQREAQVIQGGRRLSRELQVDPDFVEAVLRLLIEHGRRLQQEASGKMNEARP